MEEKNGNVKNFVEGVFSAEDTSAASLSKDHLGKYSDIAIRMFHTGVLSPKEMIFPAISDFATRFLTTIYSSSYKNLFYVSVLKIDLTYVAIINLLITIYDTLNDPLMGIVYDKSRTRWGKARPFVLLGAAPYYISAAMLYCGGIFFGTETSNDPRKIIFVFIVLFVQETFSTIYNIPRGTYLTLQTANPEDRIAVGLLQGYIGSFSDGIVYFIMTPLIEMNEKGIINLPMNTLFAGLSIFAATVGIVGNVNLALHCKERIMLQPKPAPISKSLFYMLKNKYMLRNTLATYSVAWLSNGGYPWDMVTQLEIMGTDKILGSFANFFVELPQNILNPLSVAFIPKFQKIFKNNRTAIVTLRLWDMMTKVVMCAICIPFVDNRWVVYIVCAICLAVDAVNNGPASVFEAEVAREINDYTEYMTGERPDGTINLLTNLIGKLFAPIETMFGLAMIKWTGYDTTIPRTHWAQKNKVVYQKTFFLQRGLNLISTFVRIIPYFFYDLVGKKREDMYIAINERRAMMTAEMNTNEALEEIMESIEEEQE